MFNASIATRVVRNILSENAKNSRSSWKRSQSSTKKNAEKHGGNLSLQEAALGIYSIKIGKWTLPLLGTEVGRIPVRYPAKRAENRSSTSKDITERIDHPLTEPRIPETYVDRISVAPKYSQTAESHIGPITGGLTFDPNEHPLLCDLDETRDAVMYGRGREFVENVRRVRGLLVGFHKWEITERWYRWAIICLKLCVLFLAYGIWYQSRVSNLFMSSFKVYEEYTDERIRISKVQQFVSLQKALGVVSKVTSKPPSTPEMTTDAQTRVRRELLPDSSDLSVIVKARMKAYHEEKHQGKVFPA